MIWLQKVDRTNWHETLELSVLPEQQKFISEVTPISALVLSKAYVGAAGMIWEPFAIRDEEQMVGFFAIAHEPEDDEEIWLFHFFVDHRYQRKGYGKEALKEIIKQTGITHPKRKRFSLLVHPKNAIARRMYENANFIQTGRERWGEPVYQREIGTLT